ncbi:MAG TPA: DoxX family protein [Candidatus Paceibacterota bacterium]
MKQIKKILTPATHIELVRSKGSKFGRILMGLLFVVTGVLMMMNGDATTEYFITLGVPMASLLVWPILILKVGAGAAIIVGKRTTEAAAILIIFTLIATLLAHLDPQTDPSFPIGMLKNLAIVGGLLYLMSFGPHGMNVSGEDALSPALPKRHT